MPSRKFFVQNSDGEDEDDEITVPHVVSGPDQYSTIDTHDQSSGFEASTLHPTYLHPYINQASPDAECTSRDLPTTSLVDHLPMTVSHGSSMSRMERTSGGNSPFIPSHPPQHAPLLASPLRFVATPGPGYATESSENKDQKPIGMFINILEITFSVRPEVHCMDG